MWVPQSYRNTWDAKTSHLASEIAMLRDETATTSLQTSHNSLRQLGQFGGRVGGGVLGLVGLLTVRGRGEVKHRESPKSTPKVGISAFFDRQFPMLPR